MESRSNLGKHTLTCVTKDSLPCTRMQLDPPRQRGHPLAEEPGARHLVHLVPGASWAAFLRALSLSVSSVSLPADQHAETRGEVCGGSRSGRTHLGEDLGDPGGGSRYLLLNVSGLNGPYVLPAFPRGAGSAPRSPEDQARGRPAWERLPATWGGSGAPRGPCGHGRSSLVTNPSQGCREVGVGK